MVRHVLLRAVAAVAVLGGCARDAAPTSRPAATTRTTLAGAGDVLAVSETGWWEEAEPTTSVPADLTLSADVLFASGSSTLTPGAVTQLDVVAQHFTRHPTAMSVAGHTDSDGPPTGAARYNLALSTRRAEAVRGFLIGAGVPARCVTATGHGDAKPVAPNDSATSKAKNRRVEISRGRPCR